MIPPQSSVYCSGVRLQEGPLVKAWLWLVRDLSSLPFFFIGVYLGIWVYVSMK